MRIDMTKQWQNLDNLESLKWINQEFLIHSRKGISKGAIWIKLFNKKNKQRNRLIRKNNLSKNLPKENLPMLSLWDKNLSPKLNKYPPKDKCNQNQLEILNLCHIYNKWE